MLAKMFQNKGFKAAIGLACSFVPAVSLAQVSDTQIDTSRLLVPNSAEVVYDFQNPGNTTRQQRGYVGDWQYVLYADGTGEIRSSAKSPGSSIALQCERGVACRISQPDGTTQSVKAIGGPPPELPAEVTAQSLARFLAQAVLAGTGAPPDLPLSLETREPQVVADVASAAERGDAMAQEAVLETTALEASEPDVAMQNAETVPPESEDPRALPPAAKPVQRIRPTQQSVRNRRPLKILRSTKPQPRKAVSREPILVTAPKETPKLSFAKKYKLACSVSGTASLTYVPAGDTEVRSGKPRVALGCYAQLSNRLSGRVALVRYFNPKQQAPWDPDFTYDFSYKVSDKITLGYSNYSARFQGDGESFGKSLANGFLRGSYKLPKINLPFDKTANCSASIRLPNPKLSSARLYCGVAITDKLSIAGTAHAYFPGTQESYQPDFTYTATYKITDLWNITYSNYGNNRFPWNKSTSPGRGLMGGSVTVSYKIKF